MKLQFLLAVFLVGVTNAESNETSTAKMEIPVQPAQYSLPVHVRHNLNKAHAILMVLAWLFFVPSAFVFARMLRDSFAGTKPFGMAIWFHAHRTFNFIGCLMMVASFLCIMISKDWKWVGPGSQAKYWTQIHTITGLLALILAWLQPFLSLLRCVPTDSRRPWFNWSHRVIGIVSFALATTATMVAAVHFRIWTEKVLQSTLVMLPTFILVGISVVSMLFKQTDNEEKKESNYSIRLSVAFWSMGAFMTISIALSIILAQGYKS